MLGRVDSITELSCERKSLRPKFSPMTPYIPETVQNTTSFGDYFRWLLREYYIPDFLSALVKYALWSGTLATTDSVAYFSLLPFLEATLPLGNRRLHMPSKSTAELGRPESKSKQILPVFAYSGWTYQILPPGHAFDGDVVNDGLS